MARLRALRSLRFGCFATIAMWLLPVGSSYAQGGEASGAPSGAPTAPPAPPGAAPPPTAAAPSGKAPAAAAAAPPTAAAPSGKAPAAAAAAPPSFSEPPQAPAAPANPPAGASPTPSSAAPSFAPPPPPLPPRELDEADLAAELNADLSQQIVSGASRTVETAEQAPVAATIIRADDLRRHGIRTVAEALRFIAMGTFTLGGQLSDDQIVGARGVAADGDSSDHFLLIVDGHPVNQPGTGGFAPGYGLGVPISMIDSIEVILGPGSVVYGTNAMLGVINVRTKPARQMQGLHVLGQYGVSPEQNLSGKVRNFDPKGMGTSPRAEGTYGKTFRFLGEEGEFTAGALLAKIELPNVTIPQQTNTPTAATQFGGKLSGVVLDSAEGGYARLHIGKFEMDASYADGNWVWGQPVPQVLRPNPAYWKYQALRANAMYNFAFGSHLTGFVAVRGISYVHRAYRVAPAGTCPVGGTAGSQCFTTTDVSSAQQSAELQAIWDFAADGRYQLMVGADGRNRQANGAPESFDAATGLRFAPEGGYKSDGQMFGAYAQFRGRPADFIAVNLGFRGDYIYDEAAYLIVPSSNPVGYGSYSGTNYGAVSPRAAVMVFPTDTTTAYGSYSRAFRSPSPTETHLNSATAEPGADLQPETVDAGEIGVKQRFGVHRALASLFVSRWNGLIGYGPGSPGKSRFSDTGTLDNYGFNLGLEGALASDHVHYGATFTYGYSRRSLKTRPLNLSPAAQAAADVAIPQAKDSLEVVGAPAASGNARISYDFKGEAPEVGLAAAIYGPRLTSFGYANSILVPPAAAGAAPTSQPMFGYAWRSNINPQFTDTMVELRLTLNGPVPSIPALHYMLLANYLVSPGFEPLSFGPRPGGAAATTAVVNGLPAGAQSDGQLFPAIKLTLAAGLEVNFD